jgi:hypothetical protein
MSVLGDHFHFESIWNLDDVAGGLTKALSLAAGPSSGVAADAMEL